MIDGSEKWKQLYNDELLPESNIRMHTNINIVALSGTVTTNGEANGSFANDTVGKNGVTDKVPLYATLEHNYWLLDGTFDYVDNVTSGAYVSSEMSNAECAFETKPPNIKYVTQNDSTNNTATIQFGEEYASVFSVEKIGYGGVTVVGNAGYNSLTITKNNSTYRINSITVYKWSMPYRRARIWQFWDGIRLNYGKDKISSFVVNKSSDILSGAFPEDTAKVSIFDIDNELNSETGMFKDLLVDTKWQIDVGYVINNYTEWITLGHYYLTEYKRDQNGLLAYFILKNVFSKISGKFPSEIKGSPDNPVVDPFAWTTWRELYEKISDFTGANIEIRSGFNLDTQRAGYASQRQFRNELEMPEWLQTVTNAVMGIITSSNNDTIVIDTLIEDDAFLSFKYKEVVDELTLFNAYKYPEIETFPQIKSVSFTGYKTTSDEAKYTYESTFATTGVQQTATNERVRFDEPSINPDFTFPAGYAYNYHKWVDNFISKAKRLTGESRINPGLELFDVVIVETKAKDLVKGYITSLEISYNGGFKGKYEVWAPKGLNE